MSKINQLFLPVVREAQLLGLAAPCKVKLWDRWWQETHFYNSGRIPEIRMSQKLLIPSTRSWVLAQYLEHGGKTTAAGLFAHELGHVFRSTWIRNRKVSPLRGCREVFGNRVRFDDPWNDMLDYLQKNPDLELDADRYLTWYAWSDHEEDFCECFAALVLAGGDCSAYRGRHGVYDKLMYIRHAGEMVLAADPSFAVTRAVSMPCAVHVGRKQRDESND